MSKIRSALWWVVTAPFRLLFWIISVPFRFLAWLFRPITSRFAKTFKPVYEFLTVEPDDRPITDAFTDAVSNLDAIWEHLDAFRMHLLRAVLSLVITVGISFYFTDKVVAFLAQPVGGVDALKAIEVTENIGVFMRVALLSGIALALPYIIFEAWLFIAPGISARSRQLGLVGIPLATLLFIVGMVFCYYVMLPTALPFLINFMGIKAELRPDSYFKFVTGLLFWIGIAFEFPLVIYVLTAMGLVKPKLLAENWRIAVVLISVLAAAVTPTVDPVNMGLVMLPMSLLYFVSIGLSYLAAAGRRPKPETQPEA